MIVPHIPGILAESKRKWLSRVWQDSCDGSRDADLDSDCGREAPTRPAILHRKGDICRHFTSVGWKSREWNGNNNGKAGHSLKSILFTLKNGDNIPPKRFKRVPITSK
jgi:hypothetical protein